MASSAEGRLAGKVALVTGGESGIGAAAARAFAAEGAQVFAADISPTTPELWAHHEAVTGIVLDVGNSADVREAFATVERAHGKLDVLLNAAGIVAPTGPAPVADEAPDFITWITDDAWDHMLRVNLTSQFYTLRSAIPLMRNAGGGAVINVASVAALINAAMPLSYPASKSGILGLTRVAAASLAPFGIRVNAVAPGAVDTPMLNSVGPELIKELVSLQPIKRAATPEEIARTMLFLASDDSAYYTGQVLSPSGGVYM